MDRKQLGKILEEMSEKMMIYALSFTNEHEAEDLCQSTILKIIENQDQFLSVDNPTAYAKRAMQNLFLDMLKKGSRKKKIRKSKKVTLESECFSITRRSNESFVTKISGNYSAVVVEPSTDHSAVLSDGQVVDLTKYEKILSEPNLIFSGFDAADNGAKLNIDYSVQVKTPAYHSSSGIDNLESNFSMESIDHLEHQLLLDCLQKQDEINRSILAFYGSGYSFAEIKDFIGDITESNLRVRASRARISLAECMGRDYG